MLPLLLRNGLAQGTSGSLFLDRIRALKTAFSLSSGARWVAGAVFTLMQAMLGFVPDAPRGKLRVDPLLPEWLPDLTVLELRVGKQRFDIRFWRDGRETQFAG